MYNKPVGVALLSWTARLSKRQRQQREEAALCPIQPDSASFSSSQVIGCLSVKIDQISSYSYSSHSDLSFFLFFFFPLSNPLTNLQAIPACVIVVEIQTSSSFPLPDGLRLTPNTPKSSTPHSPPLLFSSSSSSSSLLHPQRSPSLPRPRPRPRRRALSTYHPSEPLLSQAPR